MKYINKARVLLEYDKVLSQIASMARTEGAAELILKTEPTDDIVVVKRLLAQTAKGNDRHKIASAIRAVQKYYTFA